MLPYRIPDSFLVSPTDTTIGLFQETAPLCPPVPLLTRDSRALLSSTRISPEMWERLAHAQRRQALHWEWRDGATPRCPRAPGGFTRMQRSLTLALAACLLAAGLCAQGPQFKSQKEMDAFMAIQSAPSPAEKVAAGTTFVSQFPKSGFAGLAKYMMMLSYQQLNDFDNLLLYGEMVLESEPAPGMLVGALISLAGAIPARTREFDLDKEEKLAKAEDYARRAMALIPTIDKMDPNMTDDAWLEVKKDFMSQCHDAIGTVHLKRENYELAEKSFRQTISLASEALPFTLYNLATALSKQGKNEEAGNFADQCIAAGGLQSAAGTEMCADFKAGLKPGA